MTRTSSAMDRAEALRLRAVALHDYPSADTTAIFAALGEEDLRNPRQRAARAAATDRAGRTPDPEAVAARLDSYWPDEALARPHAGLLRELARAAEPVDGTDAAELLGALASHAAWLAATGNPVDTDTLFDRDLVQHWAVLGLQHLSPGTAANYRSRLNRVGAAFNEVRRGPAALTGSDPVATYAPVEEDRFLAWADAQRTDALRFAVLVLLCLGLGAGLSTAEILGVTGTDVTGRADRDVLVRVREGRPRTVRVRTRYAALLLGLAEAAGHDHLYRPDAPGRGGKNAVSNLVATAREDGDARLPVLTPQRMRATWLVRHLDAGVRVDALLAAAGLDSLAHLTRYLPALRPLPAPEVTALLRGADA